MCSYSGYTGGFYLNDIIGEFDVHLNQTECLAACMNYKDCIAINHMKNSKRCVLLKSGATDNKELFVDTDVADCSHFMFVSCSSSNFFIILFFLYFSLLNWTILRTKKPTNKISRRKCFSFLRHSVFWTKCFEECQR